jgi:hypothetical protein
MASIEFVEPDPIFNFFTQEQQWIRDNDEGLRGKIPPETRRALVENLRMQVDQLVEEAIKNKSEGKERLISRLREQVPSEEGKSEGKDSKTEAAPTIPTSNTEL